MLRRRLASNSAVRRSFCDLQKTSFTAKLSLLRWSSAPQTQPKLPAPSLLVIWKASPFSCMSVPTCSSVPPPTCSSTPALGEVAACACACACVVERGGGCGCDGNGADGCCDCNGLCNCGSSTIA